MKYIFTLYAKFRLWIYLYVYNKFFNQKKLLSKYRRKIFEKNLLNEIEINNPFAKFFVIKNFEHNFDLMKIINNFPKLKNNFNDKNINTYQSEHNIHKHKDFRNFNYFLEEFLNKIIAPEYNLLNYKLKINKMWFVISSKNGRIHPHNHLDGHISGVLYPKSSYSDDNGLMIYNPLKKIEKHTFDFLNSEKVEYLATRYNLEISDINNMIVFDSFLMHSVNKVKFKNNNDIRVSLAWDAIFINK